MDTKNKFSLTMMIFLATLLVLSVGGCQALPTPNQRPTPERPLTVLPNTGAPARPQTSPEPPGQSPATESEPAESSAESTSESKIYLPVTITPGAPTSSQDNETFYVSRDGSDRDGDGSAQKPWKSINRALNKVPDGSVIYVLPGTYEGRIELNRNFQEGVTLRSEIPYAARLRNNNPVITIFYGNGLTLEGFDISHVGEGASRYVIQIQDSRNNGSGGQRITLRNNVIHDSYNNDLIKVNNGAGDILIEGNIFYNMGGPETDSHIDVNSVVNVTIQDNLFFNDFEGSERTNQNITGHFIVIKDSNEDSDNFLGSRNIQVRRNLFFNWQGGPGSSFIGIGDGTSVPFYQASDVTIENNLFLGNSENKIHAVIKITGGENILFRNNTISGDLPANTYAMRLDSSHPDFPNRNLLFYNNIWSDLTGTMGAENPSDDNDFSDTPAAKTASFELFNNLYWNGGQEVPFDSSEQVNFSMDGKPLVQDPKLNADFGNLPLPVFDQETGLFADQFVSIREVFLYIAETFGLPSSGSPVIDSADRDHAPSDDLLGLQRNHGVGPDIGALERRTP